MEYVGNVPVLFPAVAAPLGFHAFFRQKCMHGLGTVPEKVMAGGGDEGRGIVVRDVFQHPEPGIIGRQLLAQIIQMQSLPLFGGSGGHVIHSAVEAQGPNASMPRAAIPSLRRASRPG